MARGARLALGVVLALAFVLLFPGRARATMLPVCEADPAVSMPPAAEPTCEIVVSNDEVTGQTTAAPICDPSGASAIAPPRILPVSDARIWGASSGCAFDEINSALGRAHDDQQGFGTSPLGQDAVLPEVPTVLPAPFVGRLPVHPRGEEAEPGYTADVYHPPRSA
jgi:hypothetical protein